MTADTSELLISPKCRQRTFETAKEKKKKEDYFRQSQSIADIIRFAQLLPVTIVLLLLLLPSLPSVSVQPNSNSRNSYR
jgi:hypothetical protein